MRSARRQLIALALLAAVVLASLSGCSGSLPAGPSSSAISRVERRMELQFAEHFSVDYLEDGLKMITLSDGSRFLVVPEGGKKPDNLESGVTVLSQPIRAIYLAATSAMCLFDTLHSLDAVSLSGTKADGWYCENARRAMEEGRIQFAGKYSEPDYELILSSKCGLAVESMMISHAPAVKEKLMELGIPVLVDLSSLEPHPLGRTEWIKLYAALLDKEEEAERFFDEQAAFLNEAGRVPNTGKTVAFFFISASGRAVARKSGDYVTKMIALAGGHYIFEHLGDPGKATSTVALEMEKFYATAREADILIYNSTIGGELATLDELIAKNALLSDFKAVKSGDVWCTGKNLFQETTQLGRMILEIQHILSGTGADDDHLMFFYKLKRASESRED